MRFWLTLCAGAVALIATAYLGTMTVLWGLHIQTLRTEARELALLEAEREAAITDREEDLADLNAALASDLRAVTEGAHDKALYEDLRYVYDDYAFALKACADERAEVVTVVRNRHLYVTWTVHRYDDAVAEFCGQVKQSWAEALAEEGS